MQSDHTPIGQAKTHLSKLIKRVEQGEEVILTRRKTPVAKIVPIVPPLGQSKKRHLAPLQYGK